MEKEIKCLICKGTGFSKTGEICCCITGKNPLGEMPDFLKDIFGGFDDKKGGSYGRSKR